MGSEGPALLSHSVACSFCVGAGSCPWKGSYEASVRRVSPHLSDSHSRFPTRATCGAHVYAGICWMLRITCHCGSTFGSASRVGYPTLPYPGPVIMPFMRLGKTPCNRTAVGLCYVGVDLLWDHGNSFACSAHAVYDTALQVRTPTRQPGWYCACARRGLQCRCGCCGPVLSSMQMHYNCWIGRCVRTSARGLPNMFSKQRTMHRSRNQPWQVLCQPCLGLHQDAAGGITVQTCPVATPKTLNSAYVHIRLSASLTT